MIVSPFQSLGSVDELIATTFTVFAYPEQAVITGLLSDGSSDPNYVIQSSALSVRRAARGWTAVETADMETIRGYAESKIGVAYVEEDGTTRTVIVMDFSAHQLFAGVWEVSATLVETTAAIPLGS